MKDIHLKITYIGGPTALLELGGLRLLTDPTFDPAGEEYPTGLYTLRKTIGPALKPESLGRRDSPQSAVYLSGDTVWYEGVAEVSRRFSVQIAMLFMSGAGPGSGAGASYLHRRGGG
jgi:hypothetical protein